jgi:hypothetical protein
MIIDIKVGNMSMDELKEESIKIRNRLFTSNMLEDDLGSFVYMAIELVRRGQTEFVDSL